MLTPLLALLSCATIPKAQAKDVMTHVVDYVPAADGCATVVSVRVQAACAWDLVSASAPSLHGPGGLDPRLMSVHSTSGSSGPQCILHLREADRDDAIVRWDVGPLWTHDPTECELAGCYRLKVVPAQVATSGAGVQYIGARGTECEPGRPE